MALPRYAPRVLLPYLAALYGSPVLAGVTGAPWGVIPVFTVLFAAVALFARTRPPQETGVPVARIITALAVNFAITALLVTLGWVIAITQGAALPLSHWVPVGLGMAAAAFGLWLYRPRPGDAEMGALMDDALDRLAAMQAQLDALPAPPPHVDDTIDLWDPAARDALAALRALPDGFTLAEVDRIVIALEEALGAAAFHGLHAYAGEGERRVDAGFLRYAARPGVFATMLEEQDIDHAVTIGLASDWPPLRAEAVALARRMIEDRAEPFLLPTEEELQARIAELDEGAEPLAALAEEIAHYRALRGVSLGA